MIDVPDCPHNNMLECPKSKHRCGQCGWNPEVREKRLKKARRKIWAGILLNRATEHLHKEDK